MFFQNILKSNAHDQSVQARKKFCHVIVKNYLCKVSWKFLIKIESTWRREIKEQASQVTLLCRGRTVKQPPVVLYKKAILKNFAISAGNTCVRVYFLKKLKTFRPANLLKNRSQHRCLTVNIAEFLILPVLKNICKRVLLNFFNGSLLYGPKGWKSRFYNGLRLQGSSHRSSFCF